MPIRTIKNVRGYRYTPGGPLAIHRTTLKGYDKAQFAKMLERELPQVVKHAAIAVEFRMKYNVLNSPRGGYWYWRARPILTPKGRQRTKNGQKQWQGFWHKASAPYEYPAYMLGNLTNAMTHKRRTDWHWDAVIPGRGRCKYAGYLEYGTSRMAPRPFMRPSAYQVWPAYVRNVRRALRHR